MKCNKRQQQQLTANETIKPNKHQRVLETIVKNATQMWCSNPIHLRNPLQFLQLCSHCINDTFMEASQVQLAIESTETHAVAMTASATSDDNHDDLFNALKSTATNRKPKSSTIIKDCKKPNTDSNHIDAATQIIECVNLRQINSSSNGGQIDKSIVKPHANGNFNKSEPPPLAFFPKNRGNSQTPIIFSATEPPPLVPIARFNFA